MMTTPNDPRRSWRAFLSAGLLGLLAACGGGGSGNAAPDLAQSASGPVQMVESNGMRTYRAIPYAAPPVGNLRWRAPVDPAPWTTPIAKTASANTCPQSGTSAFVIASVNEDCLYLDVFAPSGPGPFPVMVWIHGGAFLTGGAVTYGNPSPLVSRGVIVVNINYRLGAMGFLGHPALAAEQGGTSGNYGIMDQQKALSWVQQNIANFGGDKNNVTIFGESAGGFSVMTHLASPLSKGLFNRAIVQSGAYAVDRQQTRTVLEANGSSVITNALTAAGITCAAVDVACMRNIPASALNTLMAEYGKLNSSPVPSVDGLVLPKSIKATFQAGENNKVAVINGSTRDEYALFIAAGELGRRAAASNFDPSNTSFALQPAAYQPTAAGLSSGTGVSSVTLTTTHYPLANYGANAALQPSLAASAIGTDVVFSCPGLQVSTRVRAQGSPVWMYEFRDRTAIPSVGRDAAGNPTVSFSQGAAHSYELQYLFNFRDLQNDERTALQGQMATYWSNFARTGNPSVGNVVPVAWPEFTSSSTVLGFDVASGGGVRLLTTFDEDHKCSTVWPMLTF